MLKELLANTVLCKYCRYRQCRNVHAVQVWEQYAAAPAGPRGTICPARSIPVASGSEPVLTLR